ncbi:MFS transporter, UMF1 family [Lutibacter agarilyticus]|uniref:MFS transporter, UMF1 family n=1 Tax=Lutibacter agarilyticus TaxID=1109740 RepID=A0A238WJE7_9FLAO|nr:MFS transporter [Lutibacter agarilyticus]SNR46443.1 MFS transporter, UMF1 family [Lutibacter agarilyticus]
MLEKNNKKLINAWASFDWANSVYNLIVTTAIFPIYYLGTTQDFFGGEMIQFFNLTIKNSVLYSFAISFSFLIIVFISPVLSGVADYGGLKKRFMQFFTYLGSLSCIGLYFFTGENVEYGIACSVLASVGYAGSLVFYNGFLPEITSNKYMDKVSAKGFSMGYVGSVILLIVNLILFQKYEFFGFESGSSATRFGFILVGVWWMGFSQISFYYLKDRGQRKKISWSILGNGTKELRKVFKMVKSKFVMNRFLTSFFLFSMGVQTVMLLAPLFADKEIGLGADEMILVVLIIQIIAIAGAYFFAYLSNLKGNGFAISTTLIFWICICIAGYFLRDKVSFYGLAAFLGFVMGGIQSISRSTYSKLIPAETKDTASYFSFYDITEKLAIVIGSLSYGLIDQLTGSMRNSMLFMSIFFISGFVMLQLANLKKNMQ